MCELLGEVRQRTGVTTLHVTHNLDEAQRLADPLFRLADGRFERVDVRVDASVGRGAP
jgi:ABC-type sulfate/molybdate transport systems ATPase subunit